MKTPFEATNCHLGIHLPLHSPQWDKLLPLDVIAAVQCAQDCGLDGIWLNDNFGALHTYTLLAALSRSHVSTLGTMVTHPWARNPMDMAAAFASISELMGDGTLNIGISTGAKAFQQSLIERPQPTAMLAETVRFLRTTLSGGDVLFKDFPLIREYYHLKPDGRFRLHAKPNSPINVYLAPKGPVMLRLTAEHADGVIIDTSASFGSLEALRNGTVTELLGRLNAERSIPLRVAFKVGVSLADDSGEAKRFARNYVSSLIAAQPKDFIDRGLSLEQVGEIVDSYRRGESMDRVARAVTDDVVDTVVLAGTVAEVRDRFAEYLVYAQSAGLEHLVIGVPVGPRPLRAVELAGQLVASAGTSTE
jgi:5,10-methylenetetrahydromethanopterin reductase